MALRLLHVSDLHFGEPFGLRGAPLLDSEVRDWWVAHSIFDGYLAHTYAALVDLDALHDELERPPLVVSGDLTRVGSSAEARTANEYLAGSNFSGSRLGLGLGSQWVSHAIPGNHDHWPGKQPKHPQDTFCMLGDPDPAGPLALLTAEQGYPRLLPPLRIDEQSDLVVCALNTDAEVGTRSSSRVFARGHFEKQCRMAEVLLKSKPLARRREVRGLLLHHSPSIAGNFSLGIGSNSRVALDRLITKSRVQVVLTGHAHHWASTVHEPPKWTSRFLELRCGSTTSRDVYPESDRWKKALRRGRKLPRNVAMLHAFEVADGMTSVTTTVYRRERISDHRSKEFEPIAEQPPIHRLSFA